MITHNLAKKLMVMVEVLGQVPEHHSTKLYKLDLVDHLGEVHCLKLIGTGMDKISINPGPVNLCVTLFIHFLLCTQLNHTFYKLRSRCPSQ